MTSEELSLAAELLNQQIWCWGRDIECGSGNLLVRHGFRRIEKPPRSNATSLYRLEATPTARVVLRGFGVFYGDDRWGGLFLRRYEFAPRLTPRADLAGPAWTADNLPPSQTPRAGDLPRCQRLLLDLIDWIRRYEVWIGQHLGIPYRRETLLGWQAGQEAVVPAEEMAVAWRLLGVAVADHPRRLITCRADRSCPDA